MKDEEDGMHKTRISPRLYNPCNHKFLIFLPYKNMSKKQLKNSSKTTQNRNHEINPIFN
jgi:hypothetical protein